jgi:transcriptional regulator with XRE-family HTH domain
MVFETIRNLVSDKEPTPNKFTISMGKLIRIAREDANLSQKELADKIYRRQATLSDLETGKSEVGTVTLILLSAALNKPITYFFPPFVYQELKPEKFTPLEHELLDSFREIWSDHLREVAIDLVKVIANFDPTDLITDKIDAIIAIDERDEELKAFLERKRKRKQ